ncbi:hypothetical protein AIT76_005447, partial [Salmonella enterica subsp. diarizonae]
NPVISVIPGRPGVTLPAILRHRSQQRFVLPEPRSRDVDTFCKVSGAEQTHRTRSILWQMVLVVLSVLVVHHRPVLRYGPPVVDVDNLMGHSALTI